MAVGASLRRRRPLAELARLARSRGIDVWLVGGAPRDRLLGRRELDADVAVSGDAEGLARGLEARGLGKAVAISQSRPRVYRVAGRLPIDLAELEGPSIERDLARRDFTANAIAIDLETGGWIDPFGGIADLEKRRLRLMSEANLAEDPLRAFRAARLYATHGLVPDAGTRRACLGFAPKLETVAAERIQAELSKLLEADRVAVPFRWAERAGLLSPALGLHVPTARWSAASRNLARLDGVGTARLPPARRRVLRLAAIAGGLGLAPHDAANWLRRRRHGRSEAGTVARLLELAAAVPLASTERLRWAWIHDAGTLVADALALSAAAYPRRRALVRRLRRLAARGRRGPKVTGKDIVLWLGEPPGPAIGRLLRELQIEALRGAVRTRRQARLWLEGRYAAPSGENSPNKIRLN